MKRSFDLFFSVIAFVLLIPIFLIVCFLVRLDGAPALYRQKRVGINGRVFEMYKFRSMVVNADVLGSYSTLENDKRITKIGRIIRKTSIDELPQLINVIKGDMSLVGPRPNVPMQKLEYTNDQWNRRNMVLPGITGLAQSTLRSKATWQERFDLDILYIEEKSFLYDIKIIIKTVKQVLFKGGI